MIALRGVTCLIHLSRTFRVNDLSASLAKMKGESGSQICTILSAWCLYLGLQMAGAWEHLFFLCSTCFFLPVKKEPINIVKYTDGEERGGAKLKEPVTGYLSPITGKALKDRKSLQGPFKKNKTKTFFVIQRQTDPESRKPDSLQLRGRVPEAGSSPGRMAETPASWAGVSNLPGAPSWIQTAGFLVGWIQTGQESCCSGHHGSSVGSHCSHMGCGGGESSEGVSGGRSVGSSGGTGVRPCSVHEGGSPGSGGGWGQHWFWWQQSSGDAGSGGTGCGRSAGSGSPEPHLPLMAMHNQAKGPNFPCPPVAW